MYKNQLQELAQRSCFNLPSYTSIREGPDHAPRFKSIVNFNGETFQSPHYCSTLRQAEHAAAELALKSLSSRGPSHSLAARILDETGIYKNLLQEISQRVGAPLPHYTAYCSGLDHQPMFTGTVELSGIIFTGEPAKTKKQAEKNAALAAWGSLKQLAQQEASASSEVGNPDELEQVTVARALSKFQLKESMSNNSNTPLVFPQKILIETPRPSSPQHLAVMTSKILPLICPKIPPRIRPQSTTTYGSAPLSQPRRFPAAGASPYVPMLQSRAPCQRIAPAVMIRNVVPVYSAPPLPPPPMAVAVAPTMPPPAWVAPPVCVRPVVPVHALPYVQKKKLPARNKVADKAEGIKTEARLSDKILIPAHQLKPETTRKETRELEGVEKMEQLKI